MSDSHHARAGVDVLHGIQRRSLVTLEVAALRERVVAHRQNGREVSFGRGHQGTYLSRRSRLSGESVGENSGSSSRIIAKMATRLPLMKGHLPWRYM